MYNRLTWPKALCENLTEAGCEVILIDNGSTYQPLLDWYMTCPYKVHLLPNTYGHKSLWDSGIINQYNDEYYIVTDHDLDISEVPKDFVSVLMKGLEFPDVIKCGLSLKLSDLPKNSYTDEVIAWEKKFWETPIIKDNYYYSDIDTTLAVYSRERTEKTTTETFFRALRAKEPYTARHMPWYNQEGQISEEEKYYMENIKTCGYWTQKFLQHANNRI